MQKIQKKSYYSLTHTSWHDEAHSSKTAAQYQKLLLWIQESSSHIPIILNSTVKLQRKSLHISRFCADFLQEIFQMTASNTPPLQL